MGLTKKFRNKKTDQETQSPVIKVFKEMMHRSDNAHNPEKVNLIKSKHEKKTKRFTRSKAKSDDKSDDTSATCTDRNYKVLQNQQPPQSFSKIRSTIAAAPPAPATAPARASLPTRADPNSSKSYQSATRFPFVQSFKISINPTRSDLPATSSQPAPTVDNTTKNQTNSKTSSKVKCMWGESASKTAASKDDTCSCMTCALKKLSKSQRNRLLCIGAILLISLIVAMYFIMRPSAPKRCRDLTKTYEILAKTLQPEASDKRDRRSQYELGKTAERPDWEDSKSKLLNGLSDLYGPDFSDGSLHEGNLHEANAPEALGSSSLTELSNVLDPNKISEGYSSNSLRNFYKKLIQTDMQIKNLKKSIRDIKSLNDYTDFNLARSKRSLTTSAKPGDKDGGRVGRDDFKDMNLFFPPASAIRVIHPDVKKVKRQFNYSNPTGILIEKQKLVLEYEPKTKVAKCSHTPKDPKAKADESDHKHPFHTHSERLDDILERLLANPKVSPESIFDKIVKIQNARTQTYSHPTPHLPPPPPAPDAPAKCCEPQNTDLALLVKKIKHPHGSDYILSTENIFELKKKKPTSCISMTGISSYGPKTTPAVTVTSRLRFFQEYEPRHHIEDANSGSVVDQMQQRLQKVKQRFNGVLSVSTLINGNKMPAEETKTEVQRIPGHRRLLQVDLEEPEDEEVLVQINSTHEGRATPGRIKLMQVDVQPMLRRLMQYPGEPEDKVVQRMSGHELVQQVHREEIPQEKELQGYQRLQQMEEEMKRKKGEFQRRPGQKRMLPETVEDFKGMEKGLRRKQLQLSEQVTEPVGDVEVLRVPRRRLMQVDLEEDRWEVDPGGSHLKRTRRKGQLQPPKQTKNFFPIDTHNPNWKDTMPLYPDELNAIIKQAAIQNFNKVMPVNSDSTVTKDMSDTEYVEDYTNNKYDKLVKMAQAYSDYGVLDDKKEMRNDKNGKGLENRVKLSAKGLGFFGRLKKSKAEKHYEIPEEVPVLIEKEGIRFEFKPNPRSDANESSTTKHSSEIDHDQPEHVNEVFQFGKHVKIASYPKSSLLLSTDTRTPILKSLDFITPSFKSTSSSKPLKQTRVNERGLFFFGSRRRSLKSVDNQELDDATETYEANTEIPNTAEETAELPTDEADSTTASSDVESTDSDIETTTNNTTEVIDADLNMSVVSEDDQFSNDLNNMSSVAFEEFYGEITDMIVALAGTGADTGESLDLENGLKPDTILLVPLPKIPIFGTEDVAIKGRKLMSVDDNQSNVTVEDENGKDVDRRTEGNIATEVPAIATTAQTNKIDNASNVEGNTAATDVASVDNKTIVKRSAPDTNLIFWNDIYDEEYGVKDPLDDSIRDKHSAKLNNEIISKPVSWIGVKLRKIADRVRKTAKSRQKPATIPVTKSKVNKRSDKLFQEPTDKMNFAALTANMKKVCRQAAKAVQETKSSEVHSRNEAASTLMQQLVGLMSDLVEIQVQQKTCVKLPPDLQQFLVWLTGPNPEEQEQNPPNQDQNQETTSETYPPGGLPTEIFREIPSASPDLLPSSADVRTECLGTIHDVQRLITLYDGMSEEDKSKMSGVREYLENQLDFLHKQLSNFEGYYDPTMFHRIQRRQTPKHKRLRRLKRKINRFIKNFGKKRTRSTVTYDAFETYTDSYNRKTEGSDINAIKDDKIKETKDKDNDIVKRNLPDVYYRALAESRNSSFTTVKSSSTKNTQ